ncbi:MAG: HlyD family efflux transporter periplasmic adaptor subunit [Desulfobacteraceae bacterium]|nr:HlyD family efflux transporter periplasmic adaptor subunit [Desulfobacteraceae bacterium]
MDTGIFLEPFTVKTMSDSFFSSYWYRVAHLKPQLRDNVIIARHVYRAQTWYVLRNSLNGQNHRFNAGAYALIARMDGRQSLQQLWDSVLEHCADITPAQDEVIRLLAQLYDADLIQTDILPSTLELGRQKQSQPKDQRIKNNLNPFAMRFPLWDPERFLTKWHFLTDALFKKKPFFAWLLIMLAALFAATIHWPELSGAMTDQLLFTNNLALLWLTFPIVKILHEFGHAFAVKKWGGSVHEMGITLIAMTPIPYVDATASAAFSDKWKRIAVAAMGMMFELLLAAIALFIWLNVETGIISAVCYNVMLICGLSTLVFNANPLMRYDGYYILSDLIEIPNLALRSKQYLNYLVQRYLLKIKTADSPVTGQGEKAWFLFYGPFSFAYKAIVLTGLIWFVSGRFFFLGVIIAIWGGVYLFILPAVRAMKRFVTLPAVRENQARFSLISAGIALGLIVLLFVVRMPLWTTTQGVVWLPEQSVIRAGTDCEIVEILAPVDKSVSSNDPLLKGKNPNLEAKIKILQAQLSELKASFNATAFGERVQRKILQEDINRIAEDLKQVKEEKANLVVRSPANGIFILIDASNLHGRYVKQGQKLGYLMTNQRPTVRAVVSQTDIGLVRKRVTHVEIKLAENPAKTIYANIKRIVPAADLTLPSAALGTKGGGPIPVDPADPQGCRAMESHFQIDLDLPQHMPQPYIGGRVFVRFEHGGQPLAMQWYRRIRQLFLRRFYV